MELIQNAVGGTWHVEAGFQRTESLIQLLENHTAQRIARLNATLEEAPEESKGLIQGAIADVKRSWSRAPKAVNARGASAPEQKDDDQTPADSAPGQEKKNSAPGKPETT